MYGIVCGPCGRTARRALGPASRSRSWTHAATVGDRLQPGFAQLRRTDAVGLDVDARFALDLRLHLDLPLVVDGHARPAASCARNGSGPTAVAQQVLVAAVRWQSVRALAGDHDAAARL